MADLHLATQPPISVLIVEDHTESREAIAEYLTLVGLEVRTAADGLEAITAARELQPQVIVMDLAMPVLDGWEATRRLQADGSTRHIPIIVLSAFGSQPEASKLARALGCVEMLTKPASPRELEKCIRLLAARQNEPPEPSREN